jgi:hypothetical protein
METSIDFGSGLDPLEGVVVPIRLQAPKFREAIILNERSFSKDYEGRGKPATDLHK